jgi:hypothetical protein
MARSIVRLPRDVDIYDDFEVYINGVPQHANLDFQVEGHTLIFDRPLRKDRISGWRWFLGALGRRHLQARRHRRRTWGVGTYRQDDTVDVRYEANGEPRLAHALAITTAGDDPAADS